VKDADGDGRADLVTGSGQGLAADVRVYLGGSLPVSGEPSLSQDIPVFGGATLADGAYVG
jgi:hypothetical protein